MRERRGLGSLAEGGAGLTHPNRRNLRRQAAVTAHLKSEQLLLLAFACCELRSVSWPSCIDTGPAVDRYTY